MAAAEGGEPTRIMVAVNESTIKGYPHASISSRGAFEWTLKKIVRSNTSGFKLLFLHVQVPDEDGSRIVYSGSFFLISVCVLCLVLEKTVACEAWVKKGDPKEIICYEVKRVQPDFLVVGSRGLGPFQKYVHGSDALT
ncbi:UNVERIFIED_CONTAM: Universal stress protein A-like protein [Sesamum calycinum]|uniref:Universal stress protein A-like protein n=1 Tax=Sesamum calycinum TaxID=2727403 RepID=A0AAW2STW9_9LAMI